MLTAEALLRNGYLPKELPPSFTSEPLADRYSKHSSSLALSKQATECVRHNLARSSGLRRALKVPNPNSYVTLARTLESTWTDVDAFLGQSTFALSRPIASAEGDRAVEPQTRIAREPELRAQLWRGQRYVLRADVSQFYSSLYTHAIPWALHGKQVAKEKKSQTLGDRIDKAVRACSSNQTVGIPVGPDASGIVAELVLAAVDRELLSKLPELRGFRYFDDYEAAFETRSDAEYALGVLEAILGDYELTLNTSKSYIVELPQPFKNTWTHELSTFPIRTGSSYESANDTVALFSRAAEVAKVQPGALTYALRKSSEIAVDPQSWATFQALVWSAVSAEPTTMAVALDLLAVKSLDAGQIVDPAGAGEAVEALIKLNAPTRNASEVAWALWAAIQLDVELSAQAAAACVEVEDDFVALLALDAADRGRFPVALDTSVWEALIDDEGVLKGPHWLLAYEGVLKGWFPHASKRVRSDRFFNELLGSGVYFYDPFPVRDPFTGPASPMAGDDYGRAASIHVPDFDLLHEIESEHADATRPGLTPSD